MAEYAEREKQFNQGLGQVIGDFAVAAVEADNMAKDATIQRYISLLEQGNVDFKASTTLVGMDESLQTGISVPAIAVAPIDPIVVEEAELHMSMTVSAHTEETIGTNSQIDAEGSAGVGIGPFQAKVKIKASVSVKTDKKRSSDYSATTDARIRLVQGTPPEGLMKIIDALSANTERGLQINERLIDRQAQALMGKVDTMDALPQADGNTE